MSFSNQTMSRFNLNQKRIRNLTEQIENLISNAERFCWSSSDINYVINEKIFASYDAKKLNQRDKACLRFLFDFLRKKFERKNHVYAYFIEGEFLPIDSKKYRKISPITVNKKYSNCGAFVYRSDPSKVYYGYKSEENLKVVRNEVAVTQ